LGEELEDGKRIGAANEKSAFDCFAEKTKVRAEFIVALG
jgi:hypothetical protein